MKKTLVIFDCFGVICGEIAPYIFAKYFKDEEEAKRLKDEFCHPADLGEITADQMFTKIAERIGITKAHLIEEWESYICYNADIEPILSALSEKADMALLSNAMDGLAEGCLEKFGFGKYFDKIFLSFRHRVAKPDPAYYKLCVDSFGKEYDEIFMIDDNPKNLAPLPALGIKGVLFKDISSIKESPELSKLL